MSVERCDGCHKAFDTDYHELTLIEHKYGDRSYCETCMDRMEGPGPDDAESHSHSYSQSAATSPGVASVSAAKGQDKLHIAHGGSNERKS